MLGAKYIITLFRGGKKAWAGQARSSPAQARGPKARPTRVGPDMGLKITKLTYVGHGQGLSKKVRTWPGFFKFMNKK